jgi:hypothetical protein
MSKNRVLNSYEFLYVNGWRRRYTVGLWTLCARNMLPEKAQRGVIAIAIKQ